MTVGVDRIRAERDMRRLNIALYRADLAATGTEHLQLVAVKQAVRDGTLAVTDALQAVNQLRQRQHERRANRVRRTP